MKESLQNKRSFRWCFLVLLLTLLAGSAYAQRKTVTGSVKDDETGEAIPGASILVKGTSTGTLSDAEGRFSISAAESDILVISFVGYTKTELLVGTQSEFAVSLKADVTQLSEVVVVGYGEQKKSVVTGAISSVKAEDLQSMPINRIEQALQGRTSGLIIAANSGQPGSAATVRLRGITSFNTGDGSNNQPLWVVDGVIIDNGGIGVINQSDIESIEVLKDAASQAIYGARASAGVILITTKKGKAGSINVTYNGYYGVSEPARKLDLLNATQYATLINEMKVASGQSPLYENPAAFGEGTDWQATIFNNNAKRQNHEVSVSGGNDKSTFYTSFGYLQQDGIVATDISKYERFNVRLNSSHKVSNWLTFGQTLGYSHDKSLGIGNTNSEFGGPLSSAINYDPITPVVVTDPAVYNAAPYAPSAANYDGKGILKDANGFPYGISPVVGQEMTNPLAYIQKQLGNYNWGDNVIGNVYLEAEPMKGLKLRSSLGTKLAFWGGESFTPVFWLNSSTLNAVNARHRSMNTRLDWNVENTISYTRTFADKHNVTFLVGQGAYRDNNARNVNATKNNLPADNFDDASFNYGSPARVGEGSESQLHTVASFFGRLNYNYEEKYLLTALIRADGSSRFGRNYHYGYFPSVSVGWVPSLEDFWPSNDVVNFLKIRGSYGVVGNDNIGDFTFVSTVGSGRNYTYGTSGNYINGFSPNAPENPDLKWEETTSYNVGFESTVLDDFTIGFDWFKRSTVGILMNKRIPGYVGAISDPAANVADMDNWGIEVEAGWKKSLGAFKVGLNGNFSYLQNEVVYIGENLKFIDQEGFQGSSYSITRTEVGRPYGSFFGFKTQGIFQTQEDIETYVDATGNMIQPNAKPGDFRWTDVDGNGKIDENDRTYLGNPLPKYTFGFTFNIEYKGFDMAIFAQGVAGNKIFQGLRRFGIPASNFQTEALGRWTGEGTSNTYPRLIENDPNNNFTNPSDFYLKKGDYFRIRNLQVGYTLKPSLLSKVGLDRVRVYVMAENLFTFTKYNGYDPEIGGRTMSIDRGVYPQAKSYMVGLNLGF
jgi:TonB-dependent starch-binding outer membrane protein SusC